jgi:hypothetical protein
MLSVLGSSSIGLFQYTNLNNTFSPDRHAKGPKKEKYLKYENEDGSTKGLKLF